MSNQTSATPSPADELASASGLTPEQGHIAIEIASGLEQIQKVIALELVSEVGPKATVALLMASVVLIQARNIALAAEADDKIEDLIEANTAAIRKLVPLLRKHVARAAEASLDPSVAASLAMLRLRPTEGTA